MKFLILGKVTKKLSMRHIRFITTVNLGIYVPELLGGGNAFENLANVDKCSNRKNLKKSSA